MATKIMTWSQVMETPDYISHVINNKRAIDVFIREYERGNKVLISDKASYIPSVGSTLTSSSSPMISPVPAGAQSFGSFPKSASSDTSQGKPKTTLEALSEDKDPKPVINTGNAMMIAGAVILIGVFLLNK